VLQILFGDDEHTAIDGPYQRLMKTRKWVYISAAAATVITLRLYNPAALPDALKFIQLPAWLIGKALIGGLTYLVFQYAFLAIQLGVTYDIVLGERLSSRRGEQIEAARKRFSEAEGRLRGYKDARAQPRRDRLRDAASNLDEQKQVVAMEAAKLRSRFPGLDTDVISDDPDGWGPEAASETFRAFIQGRKNVLYAENEYNQIQREEQQQEESIALPDPALLSLLEQVSEADEGVRTLLRKDPKERLFFVIMEIAIDLIRVAPPIPIGGLAIFHLWIAMHTP